MRERYDTLQALRGAACLLVVAFHLGGEEARLGLGFNPLKPVRWFGYAGVDLFFVLSGFIIAATTRADLGQPGRFPSYLFRRAWRVYPIYWVALAAAVAVHAVLSPDPVLGPAPAREATDTLLLLPTPGQPRFLAVSWTLTYELMFYLAVGGLFLLPARAAVPAVGAWAGLVAVWSVAVGAAPADPYLALPVSPFVLEFLAGFLLARFPVRLAGRGAVALGLAAAGWCVAALAVAHDPDPDRLVNDPARRVAVFGPAAALAVLAATGWERGGGRCGLRWLRRVGDASYSVYLLHVTGLVVGLYLSIRAGMTHGKAGHVLWLGLMFAAAVGPGVLLHRYVEAPLLRLGRRRPAAPPPTAVPTPPARRAA
ncbi:acyltransferase [bacterium]|nr:acyltransferase [bacterium]